MNVKSIQFRLTFWYSAALLLATAVIFSSFFLVTRSTFYRATDTTLWNHGNKIVDVITRQHTDIHQAIVGQAFLTEFSEIPGMLVVIVSANGTIVKTTQSVADAGEVFTPFFRSVSANGTYTIGNTTIRGSRFRVLAIPIVLKSALSGVVMIAHPIDVIEQSLRNLLVTLGGVFVLFLLPVIAGGYLLSKSALAPVNRMSEELEHIRSERLKERLTVPSSGDQIAGLARSVNNLLDRVEEAITRERQFIADVAHELKTPLSVLRSGTEVALSRDRPKSEYRKILADIMLDADRLSQTLKDILDLAWSKSDAAGLKKQKFNLSGMVEELRDTAVKMGVPKKIKITGTVNPGIFVLGREDKLARAILNLIDNAVQYTAPGKTVSISLEKKGGSAVVTVADCGPGISAKDLPHVFDRFYRGAGTAGTFGSGLGLPIAQAVITAHGGTVTVKSLPGKGTRMTVTLPLASVS